MYEKFKPDKIIVHHSADPTNEAQFQKINAHHRQRWNFVSQLGFFGGYHYLIEKSGEVRQYRLDDEEGAHCIGQNKSSIGVCLAGNFDEQLPTSNQVVSMCKLIDYLLKVWQIPASAIYPHRKFNPTSCYGIYLDDHWAKTQFINYLRENLLHLYILLKACLEKLLEKFLRR